MRAVFFFSGILICTLLIVGCVQTNSHAEKITPAIIITTPSTPDVPDVPPLPAARPEIMPRYREGDVIDFSPNADKVPHLIILDYHNKTGQYLYDIIFRNDNRSWGYRIYPEPRLGSVDSIEKNEPYLITHMNITDLDTWFPSKEIFERTR
jgi:hypothetical protein